MSNDAEEAAHARYVEARETAALARLDKARAVVSARSACGAVGRATDKLNDAEEAEIKACIEYSKARQRVLLIHDGHEYRKAHDESSAGVRGMCDACLKACEVTS